MCTRTDQGGQGRSSCRLFKIISLLPGDEIKKNYQIQKWKKKSYVIHVSVIENPEQPRRHLRKQFAVQQYSTAEFESVRHKWRDWQNFGLIMASDILLMKHFHFDPTPTKRVGSVGVMSGHSSACRFSRSDVWSQLCVSVQSEWCLVTARLVGSVGVMSGHSSACRFSLSDVWSQLGREQFC